MVSMTFTIFSFNDSSEVSDWLIVNDTVMGGRSNSQLTFIDDGNMRFSGVLSLENNGGFASCRTRPLELNLEGEKGISIKVKGDGNVYSFRLWTDGRRDGASYVQDFKTVNEEWIEIKLPFGEFYPQFRGRKLIRYPDLDLTSIAQMGILIGEKQEGLFSIDVDWIKTY
jgi:hypothetical protein